MGIVFSGSRRVDTAALTERAARAAPGLAHMGIGRGDSIPFYPRNDVQLLEASQCGGSKRSKAGPADGAGREDR